MIQIGLGLTGLRRRTGAPPPVTPPVAYYPDVPAVALTAAAGALRLPEGNNAPNAARAGLETCKGLLVQNKSGLTTVAGTVAQATFAIVRLPKDKRWKSLVAGIFGNTGNGPRKWRMEYGNDGAASTFTPGRFRFYQAGEGPAGQLMTSAPWTEDEALVVAWTAGDGNWQVDWYSLKTGARAAGTPVAATVTASAVAYNFNIGGTGELLAWTANGDNGTGGNLRSPWPGEIQALGYVAGAHVDPGLWAQIALGARLQDTLPVAHVTFVREFDGTAASHARPAWATADATASAAPVGSATAGVPASTLVPGTSFRRQSATAHALIEMQSAGQVFGLMKNETERAVPFQGRSSGPVEVRVYEAETGRVVRDWTAMAVHANGLWSGTMTLPESVNGWLYADVRLAASPAVIGHWRQEFGVGWKFIVVGQSQTNIGLTGGTRGVAMTAPMSASYVDNIIRGDQRTLGAAARWMSMDRIGMAAASDGQVMFVNQFRKWKPKTPVMIYDEAVNGTSFRDLLNETYPTGVNAPTNRHWSDLTAKLAAYGGDVSVVLFNWACNEGHTPQGLPDFLEAAFFNAGPVADNYLHSFNEVLPDRVSYAVLALDRGGDINMGYNELTRARAAYARSKGFALSPPVNDYRLNNIDLAGHPEPGKLEGGGRLMARFAIGAARALGLDTSANPYFANARFSADRTKILIDAVAANGGAIAAATPDTLRSWYVWETGDPVQSSTARDNIGVAVGSGRFTARLVGATVELTRTTGAWDPAAVVRYLDDNEGRADTGNDAADGAVEEAIHAGGLYESWPLDAMNGLLDGSAGLAGLPVVGSRENGVWLAKFEAVPAAP